MYRRRPPSPDTEGKNCIYIKSRPNLEFFLQLTQKILEANANVKKLSLVDAKMNYIKAWQSLPDHGITLFVVQFKNLKDAKKEELIGVAHNRIMRLDLNTGMHIKTWRYNDLKVRLTLFIYL